MLFSLYDGRQELAQYAQNTHIANDDNAWFHQWINRGWRGRYNNHPTESTGNTEGELEAYRKLTYLPEKIAGLYSQLLSQELYGSTRAEFKFGFNGNGYAWGYINNRNQKHYASKLYFSQDAQNSTIKVSGENAEHSYRYAYTPFGQAYGFNNRRNNEWRHQLYAQDYLNAHAVPYLYTGKYTDPLTGMANMDARWYDARTARFNQPDQYNHANLMLPAGAQSELMRYIGRSQNDLLRDPAQQMRYGYVSGNALGLEKFFGFVGEIAEDSAQYWAGRQEDTGNILYAVPGLAATLLSFEDDYFEETDVIQAGVATLQISGGAAQISAGTGLATVPGAQGMSAVLLAHGTGNVAGGVGNLANSIDGGRETTISHRTYINKQQHQQDYQKGLELLFMRELILLQVCR